MPLAFAQDHVQRPAAFRVPFFLPEVPRQVLVAGFFESVGE
jgi:hypothetical protein